LSFVIDLAKCIFVWFTNYFAGIVFLLRFMSVAFCAVLIFIGDNVGTVIAQKSGQEVKNEF